VFCTVIDGRAEILSPAPAAESDRPREQARAPGRLRPDPMRTRTTIPALAPPFAIVGLAAGWLSDGLLANPLVGIAAHNNQLAAAAASAAVGWALGVVLTRRMAARDALGATPLRWPVLCAMVAAGGAAAGCFVGGLELGTMNGALTGAGNGALSALAFVPVCALVLSFARRADRARQGSIVAASDRRAVWGILATALAVTTLAAAADWPAAQRHAASEPWAAAAMAAGAGLAVLAILLADVAAFARVARAVRGDLALRDPDDARVADDVPALDLGLGEDVRARLTRGAGAYRSRDRAVALVLGSTGEARGALGWALLRGVVGLSLVAAVASGHRWGRGVDALVAYDTQRCEHLRSSCYDAGLILSGAAVALPLPLARPERPAAEDVHRAEHLFERACEGGEIRACRALVASLDTHGAAGTVALPYWYPQR
jgi:hypothetical protein